MTSQTVLAADSQTPITAYIGVGANLGDAAATVRAAIAEVTALPGILACRAAGLYRSVPVDADGPDYINTVLCVDTTLSPLPLLRALQAVEIRHGRERPYRNAPRTLDLDLLLYGDHTMQDPVLMLPHPRMHERAFVLQPLLELAPCMRLARGAVHDLLQTCNQTLSRIGDA